jgi:signal transduction histidine kinase
VARLVLPGLAIAYGGASVAVALDFDPVAPTTYAATSSGAAAADIATGLGLILAGLLVWWERPAGSIGPVTVLLGAVWFAPDWVGLEEGPALARSVAMVAAPFLLPLLVQLVLAMPDGRVHGRGARVAVTLAYLAGGVVSIGQALFRDPFLDVYCWSNCTDNVLLVAAGILVAAFAGRRLLSATRAGRAATGPVLVPASLAALALAAYAVALLRDPAEDPEGGVFQAVFFARAGAFSALAAGVAWTVVRQRRTRAAISRLAADLGEAPEPGSLRAALARSLGDPKIEVGYRMPGSEPYVDADGRPIEAAADGRAATPIVRGGEPVAVVIHDRALSGARELEQEIGAAARLAVDNERLRAEVLAQLEDLRSSRARIVEAGDSARRRLERDLHDGAQQRLLTLSYELRLARAAAENTGDGGLAALLASSTDEVQAALGELRDLAHGIYPAILTEAGLGPALETLAEDAPLPVEVRSVPDERLPKAVERTAYVVAAGAIEAGAREDGDYVELDVRREGGRLLVRAGPLASAVPVQLADRVGALGGQIGLEDGTLVAAIPCA